MSTLEMAKPQIWEPDALNQYLTFERLSHQFGEVVARLESAGSVSRWVHPTWTQANASLSRILLPHPPPSFLRVPELAWMMFVHAGGPWMEHQLALLRSHYSEDVLTSLLPENVVGSPPLALAAPITSHNSIHHLYHLAYFFEQTQTDPAHIKTVVEWGGGYGNLAKIQRRLIRNTTNILIDTPLFTAVQWLYLSSVLGPSEVNLLLTSGDSLIAGKVNLVALPLVKGLNVVAGPFHLNLGSLRKQSLRSGLGRRTSSLVRGAASAAGSFKTTASTGRARSTCVTVRSSREQRPIR